MKSDGLEARMSVLGGALPSRILVVDDDELELALICDRLESAGYSVARAVNGEDALALLEKQWFPVVIIDWQMPVMDRIQFTEALRARGNDETYVIMLTMREGNMDFERGYHSGVNDYLTKRLPDADLFARINAAFNTLTLRRSLAHAQSALESADPVDPRSGAFSGKETLARLHSEVIRAQRYGRMVSVMTVGIHSTDPDRKADSEALKAVVRAIQQTVRAHVDWVGHVDGAAGDVFAVVLPEAGTAEVIPVNRRLRAALQELLDGPLQPAALRVDFGAASLQRSVDQGRSLTPADLVSVAEKCRVCPGYKGPVQLTAVQSSVGNGAAIVCRHGYAVDEHCTLKIEAAH
jgi:PleD family two-component response regulator